MPRTATRKKTQPVRSTRQFLDADEPQVKDQPRAMKSTGPASEALEAQGFDVVKGHVSKEKLDNLAFMEDVLTVVVHDSTNENDEPIPRVWNGGRSQAFIRGKEQEVKRKFVEVLARLKYTKYTQRLVKDATGADTYVQIPHTALRYPFAVIRDPSPKGKEWLKNALAAEV